MVYKRWTELDISRLIELIPKTESRIDWISISQILGRTPRTCYDFYRSYIKIDKVPTSQGLKQHIWSDQDVQLLIEEMNKRTNSDFSTIQRECFPKLSPSQLKGKWYHIQRQAKTKMSKLVEIFTLQEMKM